jgi:AraC-like DNA-binding protein
VRFRRPGGDWTTFEAVIIAAHQTHAFEARGQFVAMIFVEPESREGRVLHQRCLEEGILPLALDQVEASIAALAQAYRSIATNAQLCDAARSVISGVTDTSKAPITPLDHRVERALGMLRERIDEAILLTEIANATGLSPDRFRHLFVEETGMRFRPYVLWLRIEVALAAFVSGSNLTDAAHRGGFADSAHFSRTFKRMFGITPSSFQPE